ncbi:MAG: hypothetical protein JW757_02020 [Anaerolineales bacterium]|nr:hypothetical protein [Anaerolineales bacterium]
MEIQNAPHLLRKISPVEHFMLHSPFSTVSLVIRVRGTLNEEKLRAAVQKTQQRHTHLRTCISMQDGDFWLTTSDVGAIPIKVFSRESEETWVTITQEDCTRPFSFDTHPPVRFLLVQGEPISEVVIQCHHAFCDGLSLAYLGRDLLVHLGYPDQPVEILPDPQPLGQENIPKGVRVNPVVRFFINRINNKWEAQKITFDQQDYLALNHAYWQQFHHRMVPVELSLPQTDTLAARCREEGVTVNTALVAAFAGAQRLVLKQVSGACKIGIGANLRERLPLPVGETIGFYASAVTTDLDYRLDAGFWDNARQIHQKLVLQFTDKRLFAQTALWSVLDPSILHAINYKRLGGFVSPESEGYGKLHTFSQREDVVSSTLRRNKMSSLDELIMGSALTNLTRLDFPTAYGDLKLDRMILKPGGAFPLATVNLVVGAVTAAGKLSLLVEYTEERITPRNIEIIKNQAVTHLLSE